MQEEKLFMLRLWQENEGWRASLKKLGETAEAARYFHSVESLNKFLQDSVKEQKSEKV